MTTMRGAFGVHDQRDFIVRLRARVGFYEYERDRLAAVVNSLDELILARKEIDRLMGELEAERQRSSAYVEGVASAN